MTLPRCPGTASAASVGTCRNVLLPTDRSQLGHRIYDQTRKNMSHKHAYLPTYRPTHARHKRTHTHTHTVNIQDYKYLHTPIHISQTPSAHIFMHSFLKYTMQHNATNKHPQICLHYHPATSNVKPPEASSSALERLGPGVQPKTKPHQQTELPTANIPTSVDEF